MANFMLQIAKEYINGSHGRPLINLLDNVDDLQNKLLNTINKHVDQINVITGSWFSHDKTRFGQKPYLEHYLKNTLYDPIVDKFLNSFGSLDDEIKKSIKNDLLDLILFVKYEIQTPGSYANKISELLIKLDAKLSTEGLHRLLQELAIDEKLNFINIILDYANIQALDIVRTRYLHSGFQIGRTEAYVDRANGDTIILRNPETLEDELFKIQNIFTPKKGTGTQEESLIGKIYTPVNKSTHPMVHVSWRGSSSSATWVSDSQITPGFESYLAHEDEILTQISAAIDSVSESQGRPVHLTVSGHSLGGSLSQVNFNSVQRALCRGKGDNDLSKKYNDALIHELQGRYGDDVLPTCLAKIDVVTLNPNNIASMHVTTFNAPGVLNSVAQSSNDCSQYLFTSLERPIPNYAHFAMTNGDLVQVAGRTTILTDLENNKAHAELFYFDNGHAGALAKGALIPAAAFVGSVTGSIFPVIGTAAGGTAGAFLGTAIAGNGLFKGHTEKFVEVESGIIAKSKSLKAVQHYTSKQSQGIREIQQHSHNKSLITNISTAFASAKTDLLGKREELTRQIHPLLPSNSTYAFPIRYKNYTADQAKHVILKEFEKEISTIGSTEELLKFEQSLKQDERYKLLISEQALTGSVVSWFATKESSLKLALEQMIKAKKESLAEIEKQKVINQEQEQKQAFNL